LFVEVVDVVECCVLISLKLLLMFVCLCLFELLFSEFNRDFFVILNGFP